MRNKKQRKLAIAISVAFIVVLTVFITVILPIKFGRDPLGTSHLLGLSTMTGRALPLNTQYEVHKSDEVEFILEPFQSLEYKYLMDRGNTLVFSWQANGPLYFDLRAENTTIADHTESYAQGESAGYMGAYTAAFNGNHGWFWENRGFDVVTLRLKTSGFYASSIEYRSGNSSDRAPNPVF